ncbi:hypothetical protein A4D02_09595 [Niastella koreensis]|uniref:Outer membrane efflux protein n=2 Tax=Niastella koreensis TaxID=354356 RepID=G8TN88_NIAKG|nr:TolC family protein [Niastella koreensis]AEV98790.1 outer membrane efflux protein [Niastella koreensis GR20-10]OQP43726.1 hypothetical protein A4D02_09595 [Niastella koreensis]
MKYCKAILTALFVLTTLLLNAQDSLSLTLDKADKLFLEKNLLLIAGQFNINAQKTLEIQAGLYPNPQFTAGLNIWDADNKKLFYVGEAGEKAFEFDQLILLGGKRKKQVELARQNTRLAELELEDLLRNLKYQLHNNLFSVYFDLLTLKKYNLQLQQLETIVSSYEEQTKKGNIPLKEVVRLKSVYIKLNNDKTDLLQSIQREQKDLQLLLQAKNFIIPQLDDLVWDRYEQLTILDSLQQMALQHRADYHLTEINKTIAGLNVQYQKSLAVPDLLLGTSYDQRGNAFLHQFMLTVGVPLPLWNRNQGNIRFAETQTKLSAVNQQVQQTAIESEVNEAWYNMQRSIQEFQKTRQIYNTDFTDVYNGMTVNFLKRNISIIEFVDFFESYNESVAEVNRIRKQLALSAEAINYTIAYPLY